MPVDKNLLTLEQLRKDLKEFLRPEILNKLADLLEATGKDNSLLERYDWFCKKSEDGPDCRYAIMAKNLFEQDCGKRVAEIIISLYDWAKTYKE